MNLKDAFRFQNKLKMFIGECTEILNCERNVTKVKTTYLKKKVMADAEDETLIEKAESEYAEQITELVEFMLYLLEQKEMLAKAIRAAKAEWDIDMDSEVSLNIERRHLSGVLAWMNNQRSSEVVIPNGGTGYRFNAEGNQVSYRCDIKKVKTINFDRNKVR